MPLDVAELLKARTEGNQCDQVVHYVRRKRLSENDRRSRSRNEHQEECGESDVQLGQTPDAFVQAEDEGSRCSCRNAGDEHNLDTR